MVNLKSIKRREGQNILQKKQNIFQKIKNTIKKSPKDSIAVLAVTSVLTLSTILIIYLVALPEEIPNVGDNNVNQGEDLPTPPENTPECTGNLDCGIGEICSGGFCVPNSGSGGGGGSGGSGGGGGGGGSGGDSGTGGGGGPTCGNNICEIGEDTNSCYVDCGVCGNNILEGPEQCDDGNLLNGDGCDSQCQNEISPSCGNGICEQGEDFNTCPQDCQTEETMPDNPNILFILTDDQRFDAVEKIKIDQDSDGELDDYVMPIVKSEIYDKGIVFQNAYVSIPLCCPMRASTFSGGFPAHDTGIIANDPPIGGAVFFKQENSLFERIQRHNGGIKTSLIGKWLNGFHTGATSDKSNTGAKKPVNILVPSGLDYFLAEDNTNNWQFYELVEYDAVIESENGKGVGDIVEFGGEVTCDDRWDNDKDGLVDRADSDCLKELACRDGKDNDEDGLIDCADTDDCAMDEDQKCVTTHPGKYTMQLHKEKVIEKIDEFAAQDKQFFITLAVQQPHSPAEAEFETDKEKVVNYLYDSPNYDEANREDISDKPLNIQERALGFDQTSQDEIQSFFRDQLASLQSVDRAVGEIIQHLDDIGQLDNTIIVFTSDNGYEVGGHGLTHKDSPYESAHVPLAIKVPGVSHKEVTDLVIVNEDLPATFYSMFGISAPTNGIDLTPALLGAGGAREEIKIEDYNNVGKIKDSGNNKGTLQGGGIEWAQLLNSDWKYTEWATGEEELYDQVNDPYELSNLLSGTTINNQYSDVRNELNSRLHSSYLNVIVKEPTLSEMPTEIVLNQPFLYQFEAIWGQSPFIWSVFDGYYTANANSEIKRTGRLPTGMFLSETGLLSGSPTVCGTYVFSVIVEDSYTSERFIGEIQNGRGVKEFMFIIVDQNGNPC